MKQKLTIAVLGMAMAGLAPAAFGQTSTGTTALAVTVGAEASLQLSTTAFVNAGGPFGDFTGTTNLTYKIRTRSTGSITAQVADFTPTGGPTIAGSPSALAYTCSVPTPATVGTGCSGQAVGATAFTIANFGPNAHSVKAGDTGSVGWTLTNDPVYATGTYSATVTFTISAS
jgi:hypothetical protein